MTLNRSIIGKALDDAGLAGEQRKKVEKSLIRLNAISERDNRPYAEPWLFPKFTLPPKK